LEEVDALIYVDTDVLFLRPVEDVWNFMTMFNTSQIAGLAPEHEEPSASWYRRFARHPYVPPYGLLNFF
jgi:UDP-xylose:glucoside alpha-1,3-xylosyltransferase